ncbi:MAG: ABC transporter ATP-binding protein [Alloprevotella sp.]|nr:ABC transporter ATP-binding protein [Alloprevotella sp.]
MLKLETYKGLISWLWGKWKQYRTQSIVNTFIGLALVVADLAFVWATKWAVDIATDYDHSLSLRPAIAVLVVIVLLQVALGLTSRWVRATLGVKSTNRMQRELFSRLLDSNWTGVRKFHTGNLLNRLERDVSDVVGFLTESLPSFVNTVAQFTGAFIFLFWMDSTLAILVVLVIPFFLIGSRLFINKLRKLTHQVRDTESRIQAIMQENLQHTLVVKTLMRSTTSVERLSSFQRQLQAEIVRKTWYSSVTSGLMNLGFGMGYLITFTWGAVSLHHHAITYGALIAFVQLVAQIQGPVRQLTRFVPVFISAFTATERLMELEAIEFEEQGDDLPLSTPASIRVSGLTFSYTSRSRKIFEYFDYDFPAGSVTAIRGETGSGKTTLIRLLLALVHPQEGSVTLADSQGHSYPASPQTRCNFAYVPQGNTLLSGTIRDNLLMAAPEATDEQLYAALRLAAADFVETLPDKLDSRCGEMGDGLSEGQAQRIAIARALLKDSPYLLLDEATSALDAETERNVIRGIINASRGRTLIFVTHRPEVLSYCTQEFTLHKKTHSPKSLP